MARAERDEPRGSGSIRCAIYTRKSTEEGLDQEFNSLDAQREACASYILSQRHEGWTLLPDYYDDGGYSGGNIDRPALQRLLANVKAGKVDVIVVYKVDRLTRALSDFARIVEILDNAGASFVSITQSFNTTTSMGRLTLNVLLSFAQFEREVISERVRDKIAASKRKGMWMGGTIPLGYDVVERKLVANEAEAELVRHIMRSYVELGSVRVLLAQLQREGVRTKIQIQRDGSRRGGIPFSRGGLYHFLKNPLYIGLLPHKKVTYPGQHAAIVDRELWDAVQNLLLENGSERRLRTNAGEVSLLAGMLQDEFGRRMIATHSAKGARRYRYYVSTEDAGPVAAEQCPCRIPAGEIEKLVTHGLAEFFNSQSRIAALAAQPGGGSEEIGRAVREWCAFGVRIPDLSPSEIRSALVRLDLKVTLRPDGAEASCDPRRLLATETAPEAALAEPSSRATIPLRGALIRRGQEMRLLFSGQEAEREQRPDPRLLALLAKANAARAELQRPQSIGGVGLGQIRKAHLCRLARAAYLAPNIVQAILAGRQPLGLTARQMLKIGELPMDWEEQRRVFGFAAQ